MIGNDGIDCSISGSPEKIMNRNEEYTNIICQYKDIKLAQYKYTFTKVFKRIFDFINHCFTVIFKKPITFINIFATEKVTQHANVTSHTGRQKIYKKVNSYHIIFCQTKSQSKKFAQQKQAITIVLCKEFITGILPTVIPQITHNIIQVNIS